MCMCMLHVACVASCSAGIVTRPYLESDSSYAQLFYEKFLFPSWTNNLPTDRTDRTDDDDDYGQYV